MWVVVKHHILKSINFDIQERVLSQQDYCRNNWNLLIFSTINWWRLYCISMVCPWKHWGNTLLLSTVYSWWKILQLIWLFSYDIFINLTCQCQYNFTIFQGILVIKNNSSAIAIFLQASTRKYIKIFITKPLLFMCFTWSVVVIK